MQFHALSVPRLVVALTLLGSVAGIGIVGFWPTDAAEDPHRPIGQNASEKLAAVDGLTATVETTIHLGDQTNQTRQRVWMRPGTRHIRAETLGDGPRTLTVSNGSVYWVYDPAENNATKLDVAGYLASGRQRGERIERIFTRLNVSRDDREDAASAAITPGSAPLPSVPAGGPVSTPTPTPAVGSADQFRLEYNGTTTVAGRDVYVVTLQTNGSADNATVLEDYEQTMYVDTEYFFPVKTHTEWRSDDRRISTTTVYRNLTFNPGISDERFEFDPPPNATIIDSSLPSATTYDSLAAARQDVPMPVPEPDLPSSFDLDTVQYVGGNFSSLSLRYSNETAMLSVSVSDAVVDFSNITGERHTVDGRELVYQRFPPSQSVTWQCGEYRYSLSGTGVSRATLFDIATSIECG